MKEDAIAEVSIDQEGGLYVRPTSASGFRSEISGSRPKRGGFTTRFLPPQVTSTISAPARRGGCAGRGRPSDQAEIVVGTRLSVTPMGSFRLFHLSLPVDAFDDCLDFYVSAFDAEVADLGPGVANVIVFGAQVTLHDRAGSSLTKAAQQDMHFGAVVPVEDWSRIRDRLVARGRPLLKCVTAADAPNGRAKLLVADPSGNLVEINSDGRSA